VRGPRSILLVVAVFLACQPDTPDPEGVFSLAMHGDTLALATPLNFDIPAQALSADLRVSALPFPGDIAPLGDGRFAILDRMDASVSIVSPDGTVLWSFGRPGDGPGELQSPYAVAHFAAGLAVWDQRGRLVTFDENGTVLGTNVAEARGDGPALWQRWPLSNWEEPLQLSREDIARRLGVLPDGTVGLLLQLADERFDERLRVEDAAAEFPYALLSFDEAAQLVDTIQYLRGFRLRQATPGSASRWAMGREKPYQARPLWASGDGWLAWGHGAEAMITVVSGGDTTFITWPEDTRPLGESDWTAYHEWRFEAARRLESRGRIEEWASLVVPWKELGAESAEWQGDTDRPQIAGLVGYGSCVGLLGFRPSDGPHGETRSVVLINLRDPAATTVLRPEGEPGFLRDIDGHALYFLSIGQDGARVVERFPFPSGVSCE
jgi:hypothetical protein